MNRIYSLLPSKIRSVISLTFIKYGIMAVSVVLFELVTFWVLNSLLSLNYLIATVLSLMLGIILNWLGSRYFVFGNSQHSVKKEFILVLTTSLFGALLQIITVYIMVDKLGQAPIIGKVIAIVVTFFWNYFVRKKYIFTTSVLTG